MSTSSIQSNIVYGLGEGARVANTTMLSYALRYANAAYRDIFFSNSYNFKHLRTRTIFRTANGQSAYQLPSSFEGFLVLKDETNGSIMDQVSPERFEREISSNKITDESFTSDHDTAVSLDNVAILQYSETVTTTDGATTYVRGTDYTMTYSTGKITVDSTGSMSDSTAYEIDYLYRETGNPTMFCVEYDAGNEQYVIRLNPVPDETMIVTLIYEDLPADLSSSQDAVWAGLEFALERGGIYFGSLELIDNANKRNEFRQVYAKAVSDLLMLDSDLVPKHNTIPVIMRKSDYTDTNFTTRN
jgi:hypothetical protein